MRALSSAELLDAWERGLDTSALQRALLLLATACPDMAPEALARLPVGQRDSQLLTLRELTFGPNLVSIADCPSCGDRLEMTFAVADIRVTPEEEHKELSVQVNEFTAAFRLPNSLDLMDLILQDSSAAPGLLLLERCLLAVERDQVACPVDQLPTDVVNAVVEQMSRADPQADVQLALICPACSCHWQAPFDIVTYFWHEMDAWARRTLRDIHILAREYGWREPDILALSIGRRQAYLEMIGA